MRRPIATTIVATILTLMLLAAASAAAVPAIRHIASGWWNNPEKLPALPENPRVHYEDGAAEYARVVAGLLPTSSARIEAAHGRQFAHPVTIGVYVTPNAYAAANGSGTAGSVGLMFLGRVVLSPALFTAQRQRLPAILTHELSHAHLRSWNSELAYIHLPHWFKEGLAVMVSGGGGAEAVTEAQARDAIRRGDRIAIDSAGSLLDLRQSFDRPLQIPDRSLRVQMAYRQAALFVGFLHDADPAGFARMMEAILDSRSFADAVNVGYRTDVRALWLRFVQANEH
jgi:hypothetical protein